MMKRLGALVVILVLALARVAAADRDDARPKDLQRLQEDLSNLDEELRALEPGDPKTEAFRRRADEIREETIYLKVQMRKHQSAGRDGTGVEIREVEDLRRSIGALRDDIERSFGRDDRELRLRDGVEILVRLDEPVSSRTARREDRFEATVFRPVRVEGATAIPAGARVRGIVRDAEPAERPSRAGKLELDFDVLYLGPERIDLRARVVAVRENDDDDRIDTREKAGLGAVLGGVLGGILGGKKGALIGVLLGGTGAVVGTKGQEVELPAGTILTLRLERPLSVPRRR
jgi:hypothetical protein